MSLAPLCPKCGSNGHDGGRFDGLEWDADEAAKHGCDPERTTATAFRCHACGNEFPMLTWTAETVLEPKKGMIHMDGRYFDPKELGHG